ncbi:MAG: tRNA epoxyqueuosine(34) reductase QueG, partial [Armatimonadetes bacterium]|nr:tRNA epoxyqueuosine(34) reductase QueG [Armatimonadota bacterium]
MTLSEDVKSLARKAGFHAVGITRAVPFLEAERALRDSLPTAKSVVSVALSYLTNKSHTTYETYGAYGSPHGMVAAFAQGLDYHGVVQERLSALAERIQAKVGPAEIRSFADTGPISDRSAAISAGIGSRGKNTCVYVGEYGSWVVLGELLTDIELEPDEPSALDICGECDECMRACPTGAIVAPYTLDARICLSRVTQSKGIIPIPLREKLGTRIYGCDTCQSACPLNRCAKPGNLDEFRPSAGLGEAPELLPLLNLSPKDFEERVAPTTAGWIGRARFRRNVAIALGNIRDPAAVPELTKALSDPEPIIRAHAAWSLGRIRRPDAR